MTSSTTRANGNKYKVVLLGESAVGKSSIAQRLMRNEWSDNLSSTVGASFFRYATRVGDVEVLFDIWDTAGQERYRSLASMYYRGAAAALVVYEITSLETFERAQLWIRELATNSPETLLTLVGNKSDMEASRRVSAEEGQRCAAEAGIYFAEVSAKDGSGVKAVFDNIAQHLVNNNSLMSVRDGGVVGHAERLGGQPPHGNCC